MGINYHNIESYREVTALRTLLIMIIFTILFIGSCQKEIDEFEPYPGVILKQRILLSVEDQDGVPLPNVEIAMGDDTHTTDENGIVYLNATTVKRGFNHISYEKAGYFRHDVMRSFLRQNSSKTIKVKMTKMEPKKVFVSNQQHEIAIDSIDFFIPENAFVDEGGVEYVGDVSMYINRIPTTSSELYKYCLGHLGGVRKNSAEVAFENFGQFQLVFMGTDKNILMIAPEKTIEVKFQHPPNLNSSLFTASPLWVLNTETGMWNEYGYTRYKEEVFNFEITDVGSFMVAPAFPPARVAGRILIDNGFNLSNEYIDIVNIPGTTHSIELEADGYFSVLLPQNEDLSLELRGACGNLIDKKDIGMFQVETDIGNIEFKYQPEYKLRITTVDCMNNPMIGGYFIINTGENKIPYLAHDSEVKVQWETCGSVQFRDEYLDYYNFDGGSERVVYDKTIERGIGTINGCSHVFEDRWVIYEKGDELKVRDIELTETNENISASGNLPEGAIEMNFNKTGNSVRIQKTPFVVTNVDNIVFFLTRLSERSLKISYKMRFQDDSGNTRVFSGRIKGDIR